MLQQTQVTTVVAYFQRFMTRFTTVEELAIADNDEVLHLWSGLGYYARARNLHRAAKRVCDEHDGVFPESLPELEALPGIGRSTAGAILSLAMGKREPILDGNVKRVLCRYHAIEQWWGQASTLRELWDLADHHTPLERVADYTQAIMDLGATVCVRSRPKCAACPLKPDCVAHAEHREHAIPAPKPKRSRPKRYTTFLIVRDGEGRVLLQQRPPTGVWGGLWSFPECDTTQDPQHWCNQTLGIKVESAAPLPTVHHGFTHFDLDIAPVLMEVVSSNVDKATSTMEPSPSLWYNADSPPRAIGLAAPVTTLLQQLKHLPIGHR